MDELKGKVAIVTGGASGIGKGVAELFAEENASALTIADIERDPLQEVAEDLRGRFSSKVLIAETDVSDQASVEAMVRRTVAEFG